MKQIRINKYILGVSIVILLVLGWKLYNKVRMDRELIGNDLQEYEEYMKELEAIPSDIEGLSQYDKYKMGLDYRMDSDSDYDGLTDKQEIEIYGTNPLLASTAGDLYSDKYKVEKGMDLFTYYDYEEEIVFSYNECLEVILNADEPADFYAVVEDYTTRYSLNDYGIDTIYKSYWLYNYNGVLQIDLTELYNEYNLKNSDINVWIYQGDFLVYGLSSLETCKFEVQDNKILLDYVFDNDMSYYVFITGEKNRVSALASVVKNTSSIQLNASTEESGIAFICGSPVLEQLFGVSGHIYYSELQNTDKNKAFRERTVNFCNKAVLGSDITSEDVNKVVSTDAASVRDIEKLFRTLLPMCAAKPIGEETIFNYIFNYEIYTDEGYEMSASDSTIGNEGDEEKKQYINYHTSFDPYKDELPFQNFESQYGAGGNCSGISHLTAYLFNTGYFPESGSYEDISWDLSTDSENATLLNAGLYDYKTKSFVDDNSGLFDNFLGEGLSNGEDEFVKMIGACWKEANDRANLNGYVMKNGRTNDWSLAEKMTDYLDQGKILCVGMLLKNYTGHEVNVYDYYYTEVGELIFRVYDSNIPQDNRKGYELNCDDACYLQCKKVIRKDGSSAFTYLYWPIKGNVSYMASSNKNLMEINSIVVTDENWNVFN